MKDDFLRKYELISFEGEALVRGVPHTLLVVLHGNEAAILLVSPSNSASVTHALPLYLNVVTNVVQLENGFKCSISPDRSGGSLIVEIHDIETLQAFLQEAKRAIAEADELHLHSKCRSHRWLEFYGPIQEDASVPQESTFVDAFTSEKSDNPFFTSSPVSSLRSDDRSSIKDSYLSSTLQRRRSEFVEISSLLIKCITWNVGNTEPSSFESLLESEHHIQLYCLCFQEIDLSTEAYLMSTDTKAKHYHKTVEESLTDSYERIASQQLVGMFICVYAHKSIAPAITDVKQSHVATGILGMVGNKGAVGVKLRLFDTTIAIVGAHLAAGSSTVEKRNQDLHYVKKRIFNESGVWETGLDADHVILCGDLNYRIVGDKAAVEEAIAQAKFEHLLESDQLTQERRSGRIFQGWHESTISFAPTYKFDAGTDAYDTSEKQRVPSWTDRILVHSTRLALNFVPGTYRSHPECKQSDHRPVSVVVRAHIEAVLEDRKATIRAQALKDLDKYENEATPSIRVSSGDDDLDFGSIFYAQAKITVLTLRNVGNVVANFRFKPNFKPWLAPMPIAGSILPGAAVMVKVTVCVDEDTAYKLNTGKDRLEEVLVVSVEDGADCFVAVSGLWQATCICNDLENLALNRGERSAYASSDPPAGGSSIPKELYRICEYLTSQPSTGLKYFTKKSTASVLDQVQYAIDIDEDFPDIAHPERAHALCEILISLLTNLHSAIIPKELITRTGEKDPWLILDALPSLNANVLIYLKGFIVALVKHCPEDLNLEDRLCAVFGSALTSAESQAQYKTMTIGAKFVRQLIAKTQ